MVLKRSNCCESLTYKLHKKNIIKKKTFIHKPENTQLTFKTTKIGSVYAIKIVVFFKRLRMCYIIMPTTNDMLFVETLWLIIKRAKLVENSMYV